jgi:F-type H+-transporting ATPase subunit a
VSSPLQQFEVHPIIHLPKIGGYDLSFTNSSLFMVAAALVSVALVTLTIRQRALVPGRWQAVAEMYYNFIASLVKDSASPEAKAYFPFVFTLFSFVFFGNFLGMLPFAFTFTSQIIITFALAAIVFVLVTVVGFVRHGLHFFAYFIPEGTPGFMMPLIFILEVIAYLVRPITLSVRLFANMLAGHVLVKVIVGFVAALGVFGVVPLLATSMLIGFEFFIAGLQAYIFALLTCVYLKDAIHLH